MAAPQTVMWFLYQRNFRNRWWAQTTVTVVLCIRGKGERVSKGVRIQQILEEGLWRGERIAGSMSSARKPQVVRSWERKTPNRQWQGDELYEKRGFASKAKGFEVSAVKHTHTHTHTRKTGSKINQFTWTWPLGWWICCLRTYGSIRRAEDGANVQELNSNK